MTSTQRTYSTNPNTVKCRELLASNPEYKKKAYEATKLYLRKKRSDPEYWEADKAKTRERLYNLYHNNPEAREKKKKQALERYYRLKAEKAEKAEKNHQ